MFRNHLKIALRNLWKNRVFTLLNLLGLSIAFCTAALLSISSLQDLATDQFHSNKDTLFQVYSTDQTSAGAEESTSMPTPFAPTLQNEVPGIENYTRHLEENTVIFNEDKALQLDAVYADKSFLDLFTFPVKLGNAINPLASKTSVVLTHDAANRIFDTENVIGKTIEINNGGKKQPFVVTAILEDIPKESTMDFDLLIPFEINPYYQSSLDAWNSKYHSVFVQLSEGVTAQDFKNTTRAFVKKHYAEQISNAKRDGIIVDNNKQYIQLRLFSIADRPFINFEDGIAQASRTMPYAVIVLSLLILFIASVNFINMNVARASQRLREIGMRKTLGATKSQLFVQLWIESIFVFTIALALGLLLSYGLLNEFQTLFRTDGDFAILLRLEVLILIVAIVFLITLTAGGYPAFLLSKLSTLKALKGKLEVKSGHRLRNALMVIQFGIAVLLISGTLVLNKQVDFLRHKDLGFEKDNVVSVPFNGSLDSKTALNRLRNELQNEPEILSISAADNNLGRGKDGSAFKSVWGFDYEGRGVTTNGLVVDYDYIKTLGLELVAGRSFDRNFSTDSLSMVINESMAQQYGKDNPLDIQVFIDDSIKYNVIGVVKDYNFGGVRETVEPITFFMDNTQDYYYAFIKVDAKNTIRGFDKIEKAWNSIEPDAPFLGSFLDENIERTLRREKTLSKIITIGSLVAIILSCIGLFAISMIVVNQRTKEIGVRKIVGASVTRLLKMLLSDFLKLVALAFIIATPVAWWLSYKWLEDYSYKTTLNIWVFLLAGLITLVIAILTIGYKTTRAALRNPVESLRVE